MLTTFVECPHCGDITEHLCLSADGAVLLCQDCYRSQQPADAKKGFRSLGMRGGRITRPRAGPDH